MLLISKEETKNLKNIKMPNKENQFSLFALKVGFKKWFKNSSGTTEASQEIWNRIFNIKETSNILNSRKQHRRNIIGKTNWLKYESEGGSSEVKSILYHIGVVITSTFILSKPKRIQDSISYEPWNVEMLEANEDKGFINLRVKLSKLKELNL